MPDVMRYIMITHLKDHWDKLKGSVAVYPKFMINLEAEHIENNTKTIFIKLNSDTGSIEKAWEGSISGIDKRLGKISFMVNLKAIIPLTKVRNYSKMREGWYMQSKT